MPVRHWAKSRLGVPASRHKGGATAPVRVNHSPYSIRTGASWLCTCVNNVHLYVSVTSHHTGKQVLRATHILMGTPSCEPVGSVG